MAGMSVLLGMSIIMLLILCFFGLLILSFLLGTVFMIVFAVRSRKGKKRKGFLIASIICYIIALPMGIIVVASAIDLHNEDVLNAYKDTGVYAEYNEADSKIYLNGRRYVEFWHASVDAVQKGTGIASVNTLQDASPFVKTVYAILGDSGLTPIYPIKNDAGSDMLSFDGMELFLPDSQLSETEAYYNNLANYEFSVSFSNDIRNSVSEADTSKPIALDGEKCNPIIALLEAEDSEAENIETQDCPASYQAAELDAVTKDGIGSKTFTIIKAGNQTYLAFDPYYCYPLPQELNAYLLKQLF